MNTVVAPDETDSTAVHEAVSLDPIPGMSDVERMALHILLLQHPDGIPVRMHLHERVPTGVITCAEDITKLHERQRAIVVAQVRDIVGRSLNV